MGTPALTGRRLIVTRRPEQSAELVSALRARGADVVELPTLALEPPEDPAPLDAALRELGTFDWLVLTSANTVRVLAQRLAVLQPHAPEPAEAPWTQPLGATVGSSTTRVCRTELPRLRVVLEPAEDLRAEGLLRAFEGADVHGRRVLLPLSDRARDVLAAGLGARGARLTTPIAYRTRSPPGLRAAFEATCATGFDLLLFASPSAVDNLADVAADLLHGRPAAVLGPVTERAARRAGLDVRACAQPSTVAGLVQALERCFGEA